MNGFKQLLIAFNNASIWKRSVRVGTDRLRATSLDRLTYLLFCKWAVCGFEEIAYLRTCTKKGMHVVDIGANVGLYSCMFARAVGPSGRVTAFEPETHLYSALQQNISANRLVWVQTICAALGDHKGVGRLERGLFNSGNNRLRVKGVDEYVERDLTPIITLDSILRGTTVDVVKLDVQGWELHILRGMIECIRANARLQLFIEIWPYGLSKAGCSPAQIFSFLASHGFSWKTVYPSLPKTPDFGRLTKRFNWYCGIHAFREGNTNGRGEEAVAALQNRELQPICCEDS